MKRIYFTVGPSEIYPTIPMHLRDAIKNHIPSLNHRGSEFKKLFKETTDNLRNLLSIPNTHEILFVSSALESMERTIQSVVKDHSFHLISGSFGKSWMNIASQLGKKTEQALYPGKLTKISTAAELICITQNDTSSGIQIPMEEIYQFKDKYPKKLIAIDVVSSVPYIKIDFSKIDITFFSVQKGFGLPAGLGIIIVSPAAIEKAKKMQKQLSIGSYHSFISLAEKAAEYQTPETPNVLNIFLLNKVLRDFLDSGIENIRNDIEEKAELLYRFFETNNFQPAIEDKNIRSLTTLVLNTQGKTSEIKKSLLKKGFDIGSGYGDFKESQMRIANFPAHTLKNVKALLKAFNNK